MPETSATFPRHTINKQGRIVIKQFALANASIRHDPKCQPISLDQHLCLHLCVQEQQFVYVIERVTDMAQGLTRMT